MKKSRSKIFYFIGKLVSSIAIFFIWPTWMVLWVPNIMVTAIMSRILSFSLLNIWLSVTLIEFILVIVLVHYVVDLYKKRRDIIKNTK